MLLSDLLKVLSPSNSYIELREERGQYDTSYIGETSLNFLKTDRFADLHSKTVEKITQSINDNSMKWVIILKSL